MKKRLICCLIVLAVCLSVFAGCSTKIDDQSLKQAIATIERQLLKVTQTPDSYEVPNIADAYDDFYNAKGDQVTIYIKWKIEDCNNVTLADKGEVTKVNVPNVRESNIPYKLRATLVNKKGKAYINANKETYTAIVERVVPAGISTGGGTGGSTTPTPGNGTQTSPYTVAQALEVISQLESKAYSNEVYVKGVVSGSVSTGSEGDLKFTIVDSGGSDTLTVYYATLPSTVASSVSDGDTVVVSGALTDYNGTKEITFYKNGNISCTIVSVTAGTGGGSTGGNGGNNGGDVSGNTVSIDFTTQGYTNEQEISSVTVGSVTFAFSKGTGSVTPKYFTSGASVRLYGGGTLTISGATITKVVFTFDSGEKSNAITVNTGNFDTNTWSGSTNNLIFTVASGSGHRRIKSIVVTLG